MSFWAGRVKKVGESRFLVEQNKCGYEKAQIQYQGDPEDHPVGRNSLSQVQRRFNRATKPRSSSRK